MDPVRTAVRRADREWRRLGVLPPTRRELVAELRADLDAAVEDGRSVSDVIGPDAVAFARDWAYARGDVPVRPYYLRTVLAALAGLAGGGLLAIGLLAFLDRASVFVDTSGNGFGYDGIARLLPAYLFAGVGGYLGTLLAVRVALRLRNDPFTRQTVTHLAWSLALGAVSATGLGVGFGYAVAYDDTLAVVAGELLVVFGVVIGVVLLARRLAVGIPAVLAVPGRTDAPLTADVSR
jgi:hypothetical protein